MYKIWDHIPGIDGMGCTRVVFKGQRAGALTFPNLDIFVINVRI